jgi:hypothetical protein
MRLWTVHPRHLDRAGLTAVWREALLAKAVLRGRTRGYTAHPQLLRFRARPDPVACINSYLIGVLEEARRRGYRFDGRKARGPRFQGRIRETRGQVAFEWTHLKRKLRGRAPADFARARRDTRPDVHPLFQVVAGGVRPWERDARARQASPSARTR